MPAGGADEPDLASFQRMRGMSPIGIVEKTAQQGPLGSGEKARDNERRPRAP